MPYKRFFAVKEGQIGLLLVYPVTRVEDYHGVKFISSKIIEDSYRKPNVVSGR